MITTVFSTHKFEIPYLQRAAQGRQQLVLLTESLTERSASLAAGSAAVSIFVNDNASAPVLHALHALGVRHLALRSAGYNHVDLGTARQLGLRVARVPEYSPYAVAEHAVALILALNRKIIRAHNRVKELNFSLDGLIGFDMNGKTAGIIGTGRIGSVMVKILNGFGCRILAYDSAPNHRLTEMYQAEYTDLATLCRQSDIISLHVPLTKETRYMIDRKTIALMKRGVMLINTSRGALINSRDVIQALKTGQIGYLGIDVYEEESGLFFEDHSEEILQDDTIARLMTFHNVLITGHQAFLTDTALENIAQTTIDNLTHFEKGTPCPNEIV